MMEASGAERPLGRSKEAEAAGISGEKLPRSNKRTGKTQKNGKCAQMEKNSVGQLPVWFRGRK